MTQTEFASWIELLIGEEKSIHKIMDTLQKVGFKFLDNGCYKCVYRHPSYNEYVVKVYREEWHHETDSPKKVPRNIKTYYLQPFVWNERYMIQEFANGVGGNNERAWQRIMDAIGFQNDGDSEPPFDIHHDNTRFHNNRPVVIDFGIDN